MEKIRISLHVENDIIPTELAIRAMRDSGYRNTAYALAELIDNSIQADAKILEVFCLENKELVRERERRRVNTIAVLDNGAGMTSEVLRAALQFGNGSHLNDRSGIGRFGMGLPNASISQGKKVDVWTWQSGPDNALYSYLDIEEITSEKMKLVPQPKKNPVPKEWRERGRSFGERGTLVVWSKFDEERLTWKGAKATLENTESLIGRMYRKFIQRGEITIHLRALEDGTSLYDQVVRGNDPLYLMKSTSTPAPFDKNPMFQKWGEADQVFNIKYKEKKHKVTVRASWARIDTVPADGTDRGAKNYGKHAAKNIGVSIVRADRELDLDSSWAVSYDPRERWWGIEVDFPPGLDEVFGVTNNKQAATTFSHMVDFDWKTEAESGEAYLDYKKRIEENGDPRADLIDIVNYIRTILPRMREALADQTKFRRSGGKRHDDTSVEDRATTKFNDRANTGHATDSDKEVFDAKAKKELYDDLVKRKNYPEGAAKQITEAVQKRDRKVIFVEVSNEMDAFFSVEQKPGGITEIVFNRNHPAFDYLIQALDAETKDATERDLVARIENASDTIKMLFAAWARQEIEDMPNRDKLKRMRQDWGRMAQDFLNDESET